MTSTAQLCVTVPLSESAAVAVADAAAQVEEVGRPAQTQEMHGAARPVKGPWAGPLEAKEAGGVASAASSTAAQAAAEASSKVKTRCWKSTTQRRAAAPAAQTSAAADCATAGRSSVEVFWGGFPEIEASAAAAITAAASPLAAVSSAGGTAATATRAVAAPNSQAAAQVAQYREVTSHTSALVGAAEARDPPTASTLGNASSCRAAPAASTAAAACRRSKQPRRPLRETSKSRGQRRRTRGPGRRRRREGRAVYDSSSSNRSSGAESELSSEVEGRPLQRPVFQARVNPKRSCRRSSLPLATTIDCTRMQIAKCKELAEQIVWNTSDSGLLRDSLEIRREPTPGVGLGLYLNRSLSSCCCLQADHVRETEARIIPQLGILYGQEELQILIDRQQPLKGGNSSSAAACHSVQAGEQGWSAAAGDLVASASLACCGVSNQQTQSSSQRFQSSAVAANLGDTSPAAREVSPRLAAALQLQQQQQAVKLFGVQQPNGKGTSIVDDGGDTQAAERADENLSSEAVAGTDVTLCRAAAETTAALKKRGHRLCSCTPSSCFRVLCFRGDPVLSPFNFIAAAGKGALSALEGKILMSPEENPGFEPYEHLSPAFTLSRYDMPFSLQLQADPYLSSDMVEDVKAIYANHYCAVHCKGFFEQSDAEVPCIVTRPGRISPGFFGVFYGYKSEMSFPCAFPGCGHVCLPQCRCYDLERAWRRLWTQHHRKAADVGSS